MKTLTISILLFLLTIINSEYMFAVDNDLDGIDDQLEEQIVSGVKTFPSAGSKLSPPILVM